MAHTHTPIQITESNTLQELATISENAVAHLTTDQQKIWPDKNLPMTTLGELKVHSPTAAAAVHHDTAIAKAKATPTPLKAATTLPKAKPTYRSVSYSSHKIASSSFKRVSMGDKTMHTLPKGASNDSTMRKAISTSINQPKLASANVESLSTSATTTATATSTKDLASLTRDTSAIPVYFAPATRGVWTMTEQLSTKAKTTDATTMTEELSAKTADATFMIEGAATMTDEAGTLAKDISHTRTTATMSEVSSSTCSPSSSSKQAPQGAQILQEEAVSSHVKCTTITGSQIDGRPRVLSDITSSVNLPSSAHMQSGADSSNPICIDFSDDAPPVKSAPATPAPIVSVVSCVNKLPNSSDLPVRHYGTISMNNVSPRVGTSPTTTATAIAKTPDSSTWYREQVEYHKRMVTLYERAIELSDLPTNSDKAGVGDKDTGSVKRKQEQDVDMDDDAPLAVTNRNKRQRLLDVVGCGLVVLGAVGFAMAVPSAPAEDWFSLAGQQDTNVLPIFGHYLQPPVALLLDWPRSGTRYDLD
ncbi:hypothetical protein BG006_000969 [Podila minutissima]|uniref:Uncharacterized protein n=1 Tax=Podila minutissima TaxID=64525 RepID=A0A9P5VP77_9FUNG|nr:hypothetical protein BG006_000969 [Podila minutissima]